MLKYNKRWTSKKKYSLDPKTLSRSNECDRIWSKSNFTTELKIDRCLLLLDIFMYSLSIEGFESVYVWPMIKTTQDAQDSKIVFHCYFTETSLNLARSLLSSERAPDSKQWARGSLNNK